MKIPLLVAVAAASLGVCSAATDDGFVSLFNGDDLSGWVNVNCAPETWSVREGMIHCTGHPTGALRTPRRYENFILELDWRHLSSGGNSGVFIWGSPIAAPGVPFLRAIEVQVLDNGFNVPGKNQWYTTHGDVFPIHGSTMNPFGRHNGMRSFPSVDGSKSSPEWNHYRIVCTNGVIRLSVNGTEVSGGSDCNYRKGYLGLESEGGPIDFKNIRIKELTSSGAPEELSAPRDEGWRSLFTGLDLRGWRTNAATAARWKVTGEKMVLADGPADAQGTLWSAEAFGDAEFVVDCRMPKGNSGTPLVAAVELRGSNGRGTELRLGKPLADRFQRYRITVRGREVSVRIGDRVIETLTLSEAGPAQGQFGLRDVGTGLEFMNLYARKL